MSGPQLILANAVSPEVMGDPPPAYVAKMYAGPPRKVWRMFAGDVLISPYPVPAHMRAYACEVLNEDPESLEVIVPPGSATLLAERVLGDASVLETVRAACARRPGIGLEPFVLDASALRLADALGIPLDRYRAFGGRPPQAALDAVHRYNAKSRFRAWAASAGAPVLPGVRAESPGDLVASARSLAVPAVIVKIDRGSNGFGNTVFATDEGGLAELSAWAAALVPAEGGYIVEEALAATSSPSAEFEVLDSGPRLVNVCDQRCVANAWVGMTIPPFELAADVQRTFAECGIRFGEHLHALGYRGIFDVDGVYDGTRFGVTETNLRTTGGTHMDVILRRLYGDGYTERWRIVADSIAAPPGEPFADVLARVRSAGLTVERPGASGAIITADGVGTDGKVRYLCVARSESEALEHEAALRDALAPVAVRA